MTKFTDYPTFLHLKATCSLLYHSFPFQKCVRFEEYSKLLQWKGFQDRHLGEKVKNRYDEDESDESSEEKGEMEKLYWDRVAEECSLASRLEFQTRITLDPLSLTQDQYYYICGNFLSKEALKIFDAVLKNPSSYPLIDLTAGSNEDADTFAMHFSLGLAIFEGNTELVKILLQFPGIDPSFGVDSATIRWASERGHLEGVRLLLNDTRVDPAASDNIAFRMASESGHAQVVQLLLADDRVDPAACDNGAIRCASLYGHLKIVQLLLNDPRVNPAAADNFAIHVASANGHLEVVRLLLNDPRVDPTSNENYAIRCASENGYLEVIQLLLTDDRVATATGFAEAISIARDEGYADIVHILVAASDCL